MNLRTHRVWLCAALTLLTLTATADALTGREVVEKADKANRAQDEVVQTIMYIFSPGGQKRTRLMETYAKSGAGDDDMSLIRFQKPADIKGTGLLTIEEGATDTQLLYLPELRKSKRIAGSSKANSFVGSDLSRGDMRTEDLANHTYELLGEEEAGGRACHKVQALPKDDETAETYGYARRIIWVDTERWVPVQVEFYDLAGKRLKVMQASDWRQVKGLWRSHKVEMENVQEGSRTVLVQNPQRKINDGLDDSMFTRRFLEKP
jgi:outer membrane lipoprotein-sorting protein